jgi:hypothetical protein
MLGWPRLQRRVATLGTRRFRFRPFVLADIGPLVAPAGEHRVALVPPRTAACPPPYIGAPPYVDAGLRAGCSFCISRVVKRAS